MFYLVTKYILLAVWRGLVYGIGNQDTRCSPTKTHVNLFLCQCVFFTELVAARPRPCWWSQGKTEHKQSLFFRRVPMYPADMADNEEEELPTEAVVAEVKPQCRSTRVQIQTERQVFEENMEKTKQNQKCETNRLFRIYFICLGICTVR